MWFHYYIILINYLNYFIIYLFIVYFFKLFIIFTPLTRFELVSTA